MKAEVVAVGTEILTGQIVNTNAQWLSQKLAELGIDVYYQTAVGDNAERLTSVIDLASRRSDLVILCGGLGPTEDDLTKQTLARYLGRTLAVDDLAMQRLDAFFAGRPTHVRTPNNDRQAQFIEGGTPLQNPTGLAVGCLLTHNEVTYVLLPGPPSELKPMVVESLVPLLVTQQRLYSRVLRFFGIGESQLVTVLEELIVNQTDPTLAPYAKIGEVTLRLSTKASDSAEATGKLDQLEEAILETQTLEGLPLRTFCYGYGDEGSLAETVMQLLKAKKQTITAAESLTAGLFQSQLADFPGVSQIFKGGFVTYSLEQKAKMLALSPEELAQYGTVSARTAERMAEQSRLLTGAAIGVSLTGVAGPEEIEGQAVGTVFIGISTSQQTRAIQVMIGGRSRQDVRYIATLHAFNLVRQTLLSDEFLV